MLAREQLSLGSGVMVQVVQHLAFHDSQPMPFAHQRRHRWAALFHRPWCFGCDRGRGREEWSGTVCQAGGGRHHHWMRCQSFRTHAQREGRAEGVFSPFFWGMQAHAPEGRRRSHRVKAMRIDCMQERGANKNNSNKVRKIRVIGITQLGPPPSPLIRINHIKGEGTEHFGCS